MRVETSRDDSALVWDAIYYERPELAQVLLNLEWAGGEVCFESKKDEVKAVTTYWMALEAYNDK